jgi:hypothetical protein
VPQPERMRPTSVKATNGNPTVARCELQVVRKGDERMMPPFDELPLEAREAVSMGF